jgi:hypothetical protein
LIDKSEKNNRPDRRRSGSKDPVLKSCPWCGGALAFEPYYPVTRLAPGESRSVDELSIPEPLRTVPAWACETPHCRYREPA